MSARCDYKSVSPRQRRQSVRRHGLWVITLILVGLFSGLLAYIKGGGTQGPPVMPVAPIAPVTSPIPTVTVAEPSEPDLSRPKYDFYTELPKRQVDIQSITPP